MPRKPWVPKESERKRFHEIYIDETSQNGHHFLVLGGIVIPLELSSEFTADMIEARRPGLHKLTSKGHLREMGWSEISNGDYADYKKVMEAFFSFANRRLGNFGMVKSFCSVVNTRVRGRSYSKGKRGQIGFSREIYYHCISIARNNRFELFHVYPDHRTTREPIGKMAFMLSSGLKKEGRDTRDHPFRRVQFRFSHEDHALQISDILIGAIAYRLNRHYDRPDANEDKKLLCDFILQKTGFDKRIFSDSFRQKTWGNHQIWFRRHRS
jgi:hypothetical protein